MSKTVDVAVVGGGPAGCTFAILAAQAGLKVAVVEKEAFPRHQIGESLLPHNVPLFRRLGIYDQLEGGAYQKKLGAVFTHEPKGFSRRVRFKDAIDCRAPHAYQVDREAFDVLMLDRARQVGAEVLTPCKGEEILRQDGHAVGLRYRDQAGESRQLRSRLVVDATGRAALTTRDLAVRNRDPQLNQVSAYTYFDHLEYSPVVEIGDIEILQTATAWCWLIPLRQDRISVGAVWTKEQIKESDRDIQTMFLDLLASSAALQQRLAGAEKVDEIRTVADYSYSIVPPVGPGWMNVGDAIGFVDPVYSAGVYLATVSAERAFDLTYPSLQRGEVPGPEVMEEYGRWFGTGLKRFKHYIYGYYTPGFRQVFFSDPPLESMRRAVVSILAGNVFSPSMRIRFWTSVFWFWVRWENRKHGPR